MTLYLITRRSALIGLLGVAACATPAKPARTLTVMSSGGFFAAYQALLPCFEAMTGARVTTLKGSSSGGAPDSIPERLARGEHADVVILSAKGFAGLAERGFVIPSSRVALAESRIGMAVRDGAPLPDIRTPEAFGAVLRGAASIGYSASASGRYLSTQLWPQMAVWKDIRAKTRRIESERVAAVVARGEVEIGFQQISEILSIPGAAYAGPIPEALQKTTLFTAGLVKPLSNQPAPLACDLIAYLNAERAFPTISQTGMQPVDDPQSLRLDQ